MGADNNIGERERERESLALGVREHNIIAGILYRGGEVECRLLGSLVLGSRLNNIQGGIGDSP